jgi:CDP-glycerol glycerophosphotransferase
VAGPLLTCVIVAFRDQAHVRDCLASILEQPFRDAEVLALDNASPDHVGEILDELDGQTERLSVVHLEQPTSLGDARDIALARASGEYVWFISTLERVLPHALGRVAERLRRESPDVLAVGEARRGPLGSARRIPRNDALSGLEETGTFTLDERPGALQLGTDLGGLISRREFLEEHDLRFAPGGFGHLPVTYPSLLLAERIAAARDVCLERLEVPNAAQDTRVHGSVFDVFEQYEAVFQVAAAAGGKADSRAGLLPGGMLGHYAELLSIVPPRRRHEFFVRSSESFRRRAPGATTIPGGWREQGVASGRWRAFRASEWSRTKARSLRRRKSVLGRFGSRSVRVLRRLSRRSYYRLQRRMPIDPDLAVFAAYWYAAYSCNPRAIYEKLRELAPHIRGVWVVQRGNAADIPPDVRHVIAGTREYYRLIARAKYFVNNVNFPNEFVKRTGTVHVQTHHGTPLKTMGLDLRHAFFASKRMNFERLLARAARWDYSISSNVFSTLVWERTYPTRYESLEVGYPRNDVLVNATEADVERVRGELGIPPGQRTILFAPTHREYQQSYEPTVDVRLLAEELGPDYTILLRMHYLYEGERTTAWAGESARVLDVTAHPSIESLCLAADCLLTDYSSVMFDYAVLDRPIVVHAPDWEVYRALRGTYFDLLAEPPGVVTATHEELVAAFRSGTALGDRAALLRAAFRARFCSLEDGRAAERVVRRVFLGETEIATGPERVSPRQERVEA